MILSLPKSMIVCFVCLPFREAIKIPILVSYKTKILCLKRNSIKIDSPKRFGIKIGFGGTEKIQARRPILCIEGNGIISFGSNVVLGDGISITSSGELKIGDGFYSNHNCTIWCGKHIEIGKDVLFGWNVLLRDVDGHQISYGSDKPKKDRDIIVEDHCWLCSDAVLLGGAEVPKDSIVGFRSLVSKSFRNQGTNLLIVGSPGAVKKNDVRWER